MPSKVYGFDTESWDVPLKVHTLDAETGVKTVVSVFIDDDLRNLMVWCGAEGKLKEPRTRFDRDEVI